MTEMRLFWPLMYTVSCALVAFFFMAGVTYWDWEIGVYAGAGGAVFGFLGYLLIRYGPRRPDPLNSFVGAMLQEYEAILDLGIAWRARAESAEHLLGRTLVYLAHSPELYHEINKHFANVEEASRGRKED